MKKLQSKHKISLITKIILFVNFIAIGGLFAAYLSNYIPPDIFSWFAFAGLLYPFFLILNLIFIVFWLFSKKRFALISIIAIIIGFNQLGRFIRVFPNKDKSLTETIKVLSYNAQNFFDLNLSSTKYVEDFSNRDNIFDFLKAQNADIVCLQEMFFDRDDLRTYPEKLGGLLDCPNFYYENYYHTKSKKIDAIATFSRYDIIKNGHLTFENKSIGIFSDMIIYSDTIRIYNLHLASIHFRKEDYKFVSDLANNKENENIKSKTRQLVGKLKHAFVKRSKQAKIVSNHIEQCNYPVIVCGDFNDTPCSYTYEKISSSLQDAFIESGSGVAETYAGDDFPALRIDYILHDIKFKSTNFKRHKIHLSDHFPISAEITKKMD